MEIRPTERTIVLIDGSNLYHTLKALGWVADYGRLRKYFAARSSLVRVYYFAALRDDGDDKLSLFTRWLAQHGFMVIDKPLKTMTDHATGEQISRGNLDVEIAVYAMAVAPGVDHIVLMSGDGDFRILVERLQDMGKRVTVVSSCQTRPPICAEDLREQADQFVEMGDMRAEIERAKVPA